MELAQHLSGAVDPFLKDRADVPGEDMTNERDPRPGQNNADQSSKADDRDCCFRRSRCASQDSIGDGECVRGAFGRARFSVKPMNPRARIMDEP